MQRADVVIGIVQRVLVAVIVDAEYDGAIAIRRRVEVAQHVIPGTQLATAHSGGAKDVPGFRSEFVGEFGRVGEARIAQRQHHRIAVALLRVLFAVEDELVQAGGRIRLQNRRVQSAVKENPVEPQHAHRREKACQYGSPDGLEASAHNGIFPCFFRGMVSTLFSSIRSARITRERVSCGSITSSTYPRSAATNGLAKRSRNSSIFCFAHALLVRRRRQFAAVDDVHRALRPHHRDLRRRPRQIDIRAHLLRPHHAIGPAVGLARDHRDLGHRGLAIRVRAASRRAG